MSILYLFLAILAIKFLINLSRYVQCKWYLSKYHGYIDKSTWGFVEHTLQIVRIFKSAGVEDFTVSNVKAIGFGHFQSSRPSVFNNLEVKREDIVSLVQRMFYQSIGVYRSRMYETINPLYWIELIVFLPKHALNYIGLSLDSVVIKTTQIIYWALATIASFLIGIYRADLEIIIRDWIANLTH